MHDLSDHQENYEGLDLLFEFSEDSVYVSFQRPLSPEDPTDDAMEVILLAMLDNIWTDRQEAIAACREEAGRQLLEDGYLP